MATSTPTKPAAKKKAAVKKKVAAKKPTPRVVTLNGKPAKNRHFLLDKTLVQQAGERCREDGIAVSDVLRHGIEVYGAHAPNERDVRPAMNVLPAKSLKDLKRVWVSGDSERASHYLAALHRAGWTTQSIADSLVAAGAAERMTRQAVSLRTSKAPDDLRADLPEVPELGPRRAIVSPRKGEVAPFPPKPKSGERAHDMSFRVADEDYAAAARRAKHEGAMMSAVLDEVLASYLSGEYDVVFRGEGDDA